MAGETDKHSMEKEKINHEVIALVPGIGYGEGGISVELYIKEAADPEAAREALRVGREVIQDDASYVEVDSHDDGCGDGRPTKIVHQMIEGVVHASHDLSRRAKLFGGGLLTTASMLRTVVYGEVKKDDSILQDREEAAKLLGKNNVKHGAHTDIHAHGPNCGCGAIDKYSLITENVVKYGPKITETTAALYESVLGYTGEDLDRKKSALKEVLAQYEDQVENETDYARDAEGVKTMNLVKEQGAVVKELDGNHMERFIVLNDVEGTTFDQVAFEKEMADRGSSEKVQAFVIDLWRGRMYADLVAQEAEEKGIDRARAYDKAEADFLVRSLGVAATLTQGDLPVFARRKKVASPVD